MLFFNKNLSDSGFTLVETLIYIAIVGGIMVTFISFSLNISGAHEKVYTSQEVQANARIALDLITKKIQSASSVSTTASVFGANPGILYLVMSSSTLNPTIISMSSNTSSLQIKEGVSSTTTVTSNVVSVTNLVFNNWSASSTRENIGVNLTVSYVTSTHPEYQSSQSLQTSVSLRE